MSSSKLVSSTCDQLADLSPIHKKNNAPSWSRRGANHHRGDDSLSMSSKQHDQAYHDETSGHEVHLRSRIFVSLFTDVWELLIQNGATMKDVGVFLAIKSFVGQNDSCWPSRQKIAEKVGLKRAKSVDSSIELLVELGLIERRRRYRSKDHRVSFTQDSEFNIPTSSLITIDEDRFVAMQKLKQQGGSPSGGTRGTPSGGTKGSPSSGSRVVPRKGHELYSPEEDSLEVDSTEVNTRSTGEAVEHARAGDDEIAEAHQTTSDATRTSTPHTQSAEATQPVSELLVSGNDEPVQGELVPIVDESKRAVAKRSSKKYSDDFLEFWQHYPRRQGKGTAQQAFDKVIAQGADVDEIIEAARRFAMLVKVQQTEARFVALPSTWLNQCRFDDDYEQLIKTAALEASSSGGARANTLSSWSRPSEAVERERLLAELAGVGDEYERATSNFGFDALKTQQQSLD